MVRPWAPYVVLQFNAFYLVNGTPKPFSEVTEEDHELMTPDEYTTFFEVLQARS